MSAIDRAWSPIVSHDPAGKGVDDEGHVCEAGPGRHIGEVRDPQPVRRRRVELAVDQIERARRCPVAHRGADGLAADRPLKTQFPHQPRHRAAGDGEAFAPQLTPHLAHAIDPEVLLEHPTHLDLQGRVTLRPRPAPGRIAPLGHMLVVGGAEALRVMVPGAVYPYLNLARRRLKARARPTRNKRARIVSTQQLVDLGLALIDRAETGAVDREISRACTYRDGVTILLLACRPIRRSNLAAMELGKHLFKTGDSYRLAFDGSETKNHRPYERPLDAALTPFIDRYLDHYRPILLGPSASNHIWISGRHIPMSDCCLYGKIVRHTKEAFGHAVCPHLFRDSAMTTLGEQEPEHVWLGMSLLHHTDPRMTEKHYNHALGVQAVQNYQGSVRRRRRTITQKRKKSRPGKDSCHPDQARKVKMKGRPT